MSLDFIYSQRKRAEIEGILYSNHPKHNQRIYLCSFLNKVCGMSAKDIKKLIERESNWGDFDPIKTDKHVSFICSEQPEFSSEDPSFVTVKNDKDVEYRPCWDNSIFSKLNKPFFEGAYKVSYEYAIDHYNVYGKMLWLPLKYPIFRTIEGKDHILFYVDLDGDLELAWYYAKSLSHLDKWDGFKFSGSKGFHLYKKEKNKTRQELKEKAEELYKSIKTNLIYFGYGRDSNRPVIFDVSAYNLHRFIRGYCINLKSNNFSIPVCEDLSLSDILSISGDIIKTQEYIKSVA